LKKENVCNRKLLCVKLDGIFIIRESDIELVSEPPFRTQLQEKSAALPRPQSNIVLISGRQSVLSNTYL